MEILTHFQRFRASWRPHFGPRLGGVCSGCSVVSLVGYRSRAQARGGTHFVVAVIPETKAFIIWLILFLTFFIYSAAVTSFGIVVFVF